MISYVPPFDEAIGIFDYGGLGRILVDLHGADGVRQARVGEAMQKFQNAERFRSKGRDSREDETKAKPTAKQAQLCLLSYSQPAPVAAVVGGS